METIKQENYPIYSEVQNVHFKPKKIISDLMIGKNGMPYHLVESDESEKSLELINHNESKVSSKSFSIINCDQVGEKPYSSIGQLEMLFSGDAGEKSIFHMFFQYFLPRYYKDDNIQAYGSGAAIDKNIIITAAHNLLDSKDVYGRPNTKRACAKEVKFYHTLTRDKRPINCPTRSATSNDFYIHPKWENGFDSNYDVALLFLSKIFI